MKTIFGEENFIDKEMIDIYKLYDEQLTDGVYACATKMGIQIDKRKFEHWLKFCTKLEQIDKSELIDIAIKRKFDEKDHRIAVLERALGYMGEFIFNSLNKSPKDNDSALYIEFCHSKDAETFSSFATNYFIDQVEKELE